MLLLDYSLLPFILLLVALLLVTSFVESRPNNLYISVTTEKKKLKTSYKK